MDSRNKRQEKPIFEIAENNPAIALRVLPENQHWKISWVAGNPSFLGYTAQELTALELGWQELLPPEEQVQFNNTAALYQSDHRDEYMFQGCLLDKQGRRLQVIDHILQVRDPSGTILYYDHIITSPAQCIANKARLENSQHRQNILYEILESLHASDFDHTLQLMLKKTSDYFGTTRALFFIDQPDGNAALTHEWCDPEWPPLLPRGPFTLSYQQDMPELAGSGWIPQGLVLPYGIGHSTLPKRFQRAGVRSCVLLPVIAGETRYGFLCFEECAAERTWPQDELVFLQNIASLVATAYTRKLSLQELEKIAYHDPLTGLINRRRFDYYLQQSIHKARQSGQMGYVLFVDLDDFKILNDGYGHHYGDAMLVEMAHFFSTNFGDAARIFRFGGDEFLFLVDSPAKGQIKTMIDEILGRATRPWKILDKTFYCTLSIGVVRFPDGSAEVQEIIRHADIALHQAKKQGKNSYMVYRQSSDLEMQRRAEMEHYMRECINKEFSGFEVYYQPMVSCGGKMLGAEALLRWRQDDRIIMPSDFIPLAEYLGLIVPLGDFVLRSAAQLCKKINRHLPDFHISINASVRQFQQGDFPSRVKAIIKETGVDSANLLIEVTEGQAVEDLQQMKYILSELRALGVSVAMDDFGTGYSSLSYMKELSLDIIKIDRSFVQGITEDAYAKSFIRLITELAHSMNRAVCVEGVETSEQLKYCVECGTDTIQGFYFYYPMPANQLESLLDDLQASSITTPS